MTNIIFKLILSLVTYANLFKDSTSQELAACELKYVYANVGPDTVPPEPTVVNYGCVDPDGCTIVYSPPGCGCDPACYSQLQTMNRGETNASTIATWDVGSLLCSTGQITAVHKGVYELAPLSHAGTKYVYNDRRNPSVKCHFISLSNNPNMVLNGLMVLNGKWTSGSVTLTDSTTTLHTILSDELVVVGCHNAISGQRDFNVLQPVSPNPIYGHVSTTTSVHHVNCDTLAPMGSAPACTEPALPVLDGTYFIGTNWFYLYQGRGDMCKSQQGQCLAAISYGDGDGSEATIWQSNDKFSDYFVMLDTASNSAIISENAGTACLKNGQSWLNIDFESSGVFANWQTRASDNTLSKGDIITCSAPVNFIVQFPKKEMNYFGYQSLAAWQIGHDNVIETCSSSPSSNPTNNPTTPEPTSNPSHAPTSEPTSSPTKSPTTNPSHSPTSEPTIGPTKNPTTLESTHEPTSAPNSEPILSPTSSQRKSIMVKIVTPLSVALLVVLGIVVFAYSRRKKYLDSNNADDERRQPKLSTLPLPAKKEIIAKFSDMDKEGGEAMFGIFEENGDENPFEFDATKFFLNPNFS